MSAKRVKQFQSKNSGTKDESVGVSGAAAPCVEVSAANSGDGVTAFDKKVGNQEIYYDAQTREYLITNARGFRITQTEWQLRKRLAKNGFSGACRKGAELSEIDRALIWIQDFRSVTYYGRLAGRREGYFELYGNRVLVTESPKLVDPVPGKFPIIDAFFSGLLRDGDREHGETQWSVFMGWLQTSIHALRLGQIQQAQAVAIAGPTGCGKSLAQLLITEALGGRCAKAAPFMMGRTDFNGELFEAEHLMLEDEFMLTSTRDRLRLGASIKTMTVSTKVAHCHRKHRQAINLPVWWRVTISVNDDPEALMVLPPLDEHVADKITLLRASRFDMPMPTGTTEEKEAFWNAMVAELPAFIHWLLNVFEIPEELRDPRRYVVKTWHHPIVREALECLSPEVELLELIDRAEVCRSGEWCGTAAELETQLTDCTTTRHSALRLLQWRGACGTYLGRLAEKRPDRVEAARTSKRREWLIAPESRSTSTKAP